MIAQWDQEFIWVFYPKWTWWQRPSYSTQKPPEQFFKETEILEVADLHFTVLEKPLFQKYTSTPYIYMPLPQLIRHTDRIFEQVKDEKIALLNHTSYAGKIDHTIRNVIRPFGNPINLFSSYSFHRPHSGKIFCVKHGLPQGSVVYGRMRSYEYMKELSKCYVAIDDQENYIGWSRFVMECALTSVPCIGSNHANKIFFPELYVKHKDYKRQKELLNRLFNDEAFHERMVQFGFQKVHEHLDTDRLCEKLLRIAEELNVSNTKIDVSKWMFVKFLAHLRMAQKTIPNRPESGTVFDNIHNRNLNAGDWDELYGKWKTYIDNPKVYKELLAISKLDKWNGWYYR